MNELFDGQRARLSKAEDERLWKNVRAGTIGGARRRSAFKIPVALVGTVAVCAIAVVVMNQDGVPDPRGIVLEEKAVGTDHEAPSRDAEVRVDDAKNERAGRLRSLGYTGGEETDADWNEAKERAADAIARSATREEAPPANAPGAVEGETLQKVKPAGPADQAAGRSGADVRPGTSGLAQGGKDEGAEEPVPLPIEEITEAIRRKSGGVDPEGALHVRGSRAADASVDGIQLQGTPSAATASPIRALPMEDLRIELEAQAAPPRVASEDESRKRSGERPRPSILGDDVDDPGETPPVARAIDAMFFQHYGVNPFVATESDALATFAVDVDNASYSIARSYLNRNVLPPAAAVRVEEFVNAFDHDYAPPSGDAVADVDPDLSHERTFAIHLDAAPSPLHDDVVLLRVGLKGREVEKIDRKPLNLTFVIDVSGSMKREGRLELVKRSLIDLLYSLNADDKVAIVTYSTTAHVASPPTSVKNRWALERVIENLAPRSSTNAEAGLRLGYELAEQAYDPAEENRVILCSDGVANVGETGPDGILAEIEKAAGRGIYMTAIGVGMGNYNDVLLEQIANRGDGNYYYVDSEAESKRVLVDGMLGTLQTIARDVKIQVELTPGIVVSYRLLGYENRDVADEDFRNNAVDAGEVGAGHEVTALFELVLDRESRPRGNVAVVRVRFEDPDTGLVTEDYDTLTHRDLRRSFDRMPTSFKLDAAVAGFAEILRGSYFARDDSFRDVIEVARDVAGDTRGREDVAELITLMSKAERLWGEDRDVDWGERERAWLEGE